MDKQEQKAPDSVILPGCMDDEPHSGNDMSFKTMLERFYQQSLSESVETDWLIQSNTQRPAP